MNIVQIGLGQWGQNHHRILSEMGVLTAVCDTDQTRLAEARETGLLAYDSLDEMLKCIDADIAFVTTPTHTHFHISHKLLISGCHVFVEKPFTQSVNDGAVLRRLAEKKGLKLTCGYIERFNPVTQHIAKYKSKPILLEFHRQSKIPIRIKDVGVIMDTAVHDIDTACHLFNEYPKSVSAITKKMQREDVEDMAVITLEFNQGIATITANWNTNVKSRLVHATYQDFIVRGDFVEKTVNYTHMNGNTENFKFEVENPLKDEIIHFLECISLDMSPKVTPQHANMVTAIANMAMTDASE